MRSSSPEPHRTTRRLVLCTTAVLAALACTGTAGASVTQTGTATSTLTSFVITGVQPVGSYTLLQFDTTRVLAGALSGQVAEHFANLQAADGSVLVSGTGVFTGTLAGCGAVQARLAVVGSANPTGEMHATLFSLGVRPWLTGTVTGNIFTPFLSYQLTYRC